MSLLGFPGRKVVKEGQEHRLVPKGGTDPLFQSPPPPAWSSLEVARWPGTGKPVLGKGQAS